MVKTAYIPVELAFITALTTYLGVHMTLHRAESTGAKLAYKLGFAICGIVACILIWIQTRRNIQSEALIQAQIKQIATNTLLPPRVQINNTVPVPNVIIQNPFRANNDRGDNSDKESLALQALSEAEIKSTVTTFAQRMRAFESETHAKMADDYGYSSSVVEPGVKAKPNERVMRDYVESSVIYNQTLLAEAVELRAELWRRLMKIPSADFNPDRSLAAFSARPTVYPDDDKNIFEEQPLRDGADYLEKLAGELNTKSAIRGIH